jgi:N-acetylglucosamine-6-phosphate deacetylase
MGVAAIIRDRFVAAGEYMVEWELYNGLSSAEKSRAMPPHKDLELEAIAEIIRGERLVHSHSYRQDEIFMLCELAADFGFKLGTLQHVLEGYKVAPEIARHGAGASTFSDWWAYKFEVYDAIPYNGALMHKAGVVVSFNSDDAELARRLNQEAAKAVKYGGVPRTEALKFVTLNPARQLRIEKYVGSIEVGKHADLAIWSGDPLSNFTRCEQTWIEGRKFFDREDDAKLRQHASEMRATLVQKILASGVDMMKPGEALPDDSKLWPRNDVFCRTHEKNHRQGGR